MAAEQAVVRHHNAITQDAIVPKMVSRHEKITVADRRPASLRAAAMDGAVFTNCIVVSNFDRALNLWIETQVLRCRANNGAVTNKITGPHLDRAFNYSVRLDLAFVADHGPGPDHAEGTDLDVRAEFSAGIDNRCRM